MTSQPFSVFLLCFYTISQTKTNVKIIAGEFNIRSQIEYLQNRIGDSLVLWLDWDMENIEKLETEKTILSQIKISDFNEKTENLRQWVGKENFFEI